MRAKVSSLTQRRFREDPGQGHWYDNIFLNDLLHSHDLKTFDWSDARHGLKALLAEDPWTVGDVLRLALSKFPEYSEVVHGPLELIDAPLPTEVPIATDLFNEKKSYLLIGGIGSLGLQIALWMYEVSSTLYLCFLLLTLYSAWCTVHRFDVAFGSRIAHSEG